MSTNEADALDLVLNSRFLAGVDRARLDLAVSGATAPADPERRARFLKGLQERLAIERVVELMLSSAFGHGLQHHCLTRLPLVLNAETVLTAFAALKGKKPNNKAVVRIGAGYPKARARPLTAKDVLRCRVIGVDLQTLTLRDDPKKGASCAFTSEISAIAAARSMTYTFLNYIKDGHARLSGNIVGPGGTITVEYSARLGGYALVAPITMLGADVSTGVVGFITTLKFNEIAGTIQQLLRTLKPKNPADYTRLLLMVLDEVTRKVDDVSMGTVRAIYKSDHTPDVFYLFSLYPEPPSHF